LRLIRGKTAAAQPAAQSSAGAQPATGPASPWRVTGWQWVFVATVLLGLVLIVEVVTLVIQLTRPAPTIQIATPAPSAVAAATEPTAAREPIPSLAQSVARPVFVAPITTGTGDAGPKPPSQDAKQLAGRLTLTGIITGDPPQAIIEDAESKKTHFVSPGQTVVDGAVVEQVMENRVILNLQGEKVELGL